MSHLKSNYFMPFSPLLSATLKEDIKLHFDKLAGHGAI